MGLLAALTIGTILLVLVLILLQFFFVILSLFVSGKIIGSINDEFSSAMRTFGWLFLIGVGFSLLSALVGFLLASLAIVVMPILFIVLIVVNFVIVKKIYDLGVGKTFLFLILFIIFNTIFTAVSIFLSTLIFSFSILGMISGSSLLLDSSSVVNEQIEIVETVDDVVAEEIEEIDEKVEKRKPKFPTSDKVLTEESQLIEEELDEGVAE